MSDKKRATLLLENGQKFQGYSFGSDRSVSGEVVFSTAMMGYPESHTDPSYSGQILVITFPLVGNYGVPADTQVDGLLQFFESEKIHIRALVVSDYSFEHSHWNAVKSLDAWMKENNVPGIYGVDTREITKILRESGALLGKLNVDGSAPAAEFDNPNKRNLVADVSCKSVIEYGNGEHRIVLVDCGCKHTIIKYLMKRGATVIRVPWDYDFTQIPYDGLMISNGPGDPQLCAPTIEHIKKAMAIGKPIFGICLGNQLLSIAAGAKTYKMKYGHRSHNQPAIEVGTNMAVISSQNHGFAVDAATLEPGWRMYFKNLNDDTCEGIIHETKPFFSVQFHPEASGGPVDTEFLFDKFIKNIEACKA